MTKTVYLTRDILAHNIAACEPLPPPGPSATVLVSKCYTSTMLYIRASQTARLLLLRLILTFGFFLQRQNTDTRCKACKHYVTFGRGASSELITAARVGPRFLPRRAALKGTSVVMMPRAGARMHACDSGLLSEHLHFIHMFALLIRPALSMDM